MVLMLLKRHPEIDESDSIIFMPSHIASFMLFTYCFHTGIIGNVGVYILSITFLIGHLSFIIDFLWILTNDFDEEDDDWINGRIILDDSTSDLDTNTSINST
eukprot:UN19007